MACLPTVVDSWLGEDENPDDGITQSNVEIIAALTKALDSVDGAPDLYDVIGFDACLMQAVSAMDEYRDVASYVLASETTKPGHGKFNILYRVPCFIVTHNTPCHN